MKTKNNASSEAVERKKYVLNYYLKARNLKVKELAERCGYEAQTVYNMLSSGNITSEAAQRFADVLLCTPEELLNGQLSKEVLDLVSSEKARQDLEIVSDERLWMRTMLLSQQRTIENLSVIAREKMNAGK